VRVEELASGEDARDEKMSGEEGERKPPSISKLALAAPKLLVAEEERKKKGNALGANLLLLLRGGAAAIFARRRVFVYLSAVKLIQDPAIVLQLLEVVVLQTRPIDHDRHSFLGGAVWPRASKQASVS
jgi:hypothetical protein